MTDARTLLLAAIERMDRARTILTDGNPRPECNWGILATEDLRAHLAAEQQEPVAWRWRERPHESRAWGDWRCNAYSKPQGPEGPLFHVEPLYATPPAAPVPEIESLVRDIHKAVKRGEDTQDHGLIGNLRCILDHVLPDPPDMTAPAPVVPLTDEQIEAIVAATPDGSAIFDFARAIERAHGIVARPGASDE